jgi:hypothetical protein
LLLFPGSEILSIKCQVVKPLDDRASLPPIQGSYTEVPFPKPLGEKLASELGLPQEVGSASPRVAVDPRADTQVVKKKKGHLRKEFTAC